MTLDVTRPEGRALLDRLCAGADALIETCDPDQLAAARLDYATLHAAHPQLVVCSITPFGRSGPYAAYRASDLTITAMGGNMALTGDPDRAPLRCTMPSSYYHGGAEAASGLLVALLARAVIGHGQHVDVSLQAAMVSTIMTGASQWAMDRRDRRRTGASYPVGKTLQREVWRCKDGFVSYALRGGPARIPGLQATERWLAEERHRGAGMGGPRLEGVQPQRSHAGAGRRAVGAAAGALSRASRCASSSRSRCARGVMLAPVNDAREIAQSAQLRSREFFVEVDDREARPRVRAAGALREDDAVEIDVRGPRRGSASTTPRSTATRDRRGGARRAAPRRRDLRRTAWISSEAAGLRRVEGSRARRRRRRPDRACATSPTTARP